MEPGAHKPQDDQCSHRRAVMPEERVGCSLARGLLVKYPCRNPFLHQCPHVEGRSRASGRRRVSREAASVEWKELAASL